MSPSARVDAGQAAIHETNKRLLRDLINRHDGVVLVGAGLSVAGGYPTWEQSIGGLCTACRVPWTDAPSTEVLMELADKCRRQDRPAYEQEIRRQFDRNPPQTATAYRKLHAARFQAYLSLNFDRALEDEFRGDVQVSVWPALFAEDVARVGGGAPALFYLHGTVQRVDDWHAGRIVLGAEQFRAAYAPNSQLSSFLVQVLTRRSCVVIGGSVGEPNFVQLLKHCQDVVKAMTLPAGAARGMPPAPKHFAIVALPEEGDLHDDCARIEEAGLVVVPYEKKDARHTGLADLLDELIPPSYAPSRHGLAAGEEPNG